MKRFEKAYFLLFLQDGGSHGGGRGGRVEYLDFLLYKRIQHIN